MDQCKQLSLFDLTPYIVSQPTEDNMWPAILKAKPQNQFHDIQLELELLAEVANDADN